MIPAMVAGCPLVATGEIKMTKELTLTASYVRDWKLAEAFREIVSNAIDAETEMGAKCSVEYKGNKIVVTSDGCTMPREVLLFGQSSKMDREDTIGRFGEGLKLGMLAAVRQGHPIKIKTGDESWTPKIAKSSAFNADVLAIDIKTGLAWENIVRIEIGNVDFDDWCEMATMFLRFDPEAGKSAKGGYYGSVITSPDFAGRMYVKGVLVQQNDKMRYGIDFAHARTDRDRKMIDGYDSKYYRRIIWSSAAENDDAMFQKLVQCIEDQTDDVLIEDQCDVQCFDKKIITKMVEAFKLRYGDDAFPAETQADARELEFVGRKGIVVNKAKRLILESQMGSRATLIADMRKQPKTIHPESSLSPVERRSLHEAIRLVQKAVPGVTIERVKVVDFHDEMIVGRFDVDTILVSRRILTNEDETLVTIVHESAHLAGGDGEKSFEDMRDCIWLAIVRAVQKGE